VPSLLSLADEIAGKPTRGGSRPFGTLRDFGRGRRERLAGVHYIGYPVDNGAAKQVAPPLGHDYGCGPDSYPGVHRFSLLPIYVFKAIR
jgi:hypothetical protein